MYGMWVRKWKNLYKVKVPSCCYMLAIREISKYSYLHLPFVGVPSLHPKKHVELTSL